MSSSFRRELAKAYGRDYGMPNIIGFHGSSSQWCKELMFTGRPCPQPFCATAETSSAASATPTVADAIIDALSHSLSTPTETLLSDSPAAHARIYCSTPLATAVAAAACDRMKGIQEVVRHQPVGETNWEYRVGKALGWNEETSQEEKLRGYGMLGYNRPVIQVMLKVESAERLQHKREKRDLGFTRSYVIDIVEVTGKRSKEEEEEEACLEKLIQALRKITLQEKDSRSTGQELPEEKANSEQERTREIYPEAELIEKEEILGTKDAENLTIAPGKCAQEDERLEVGTTAPSQDERIQREIQNRSLFDIWMEFVYSERIQEGMYNNLVETNKRGEGAVQQLSRQRKYTSKMPRQKLVGVCCEDRNDQTLETTDQLGNLHPEGARDQGTMWYPIRRRNTGKAAKTKSGLSGDLRTDYQKTASCKHAVWPKYVANHCGKQHGVDLVQAAAIAAGYENDADLRHEPEELELPPFVETPVPFLPIHNGLACRVDPDACRYVSITVNSMLSHIKVAHRPAERSTTATRLRQRQQAIGADTRRWRDTYCQRFFTNGAKSSYFAVRSVPRGTVDPFGQLMAHTAAGYEKTLRDSRAAVGGRGSDEPNPLLQWTGWDKYLEGYEWADLLALTERPDPVEEPIASAIWTVIEEVCHIANETVRAAAVETRLQATRIRPGKQRVFALQAIPDQRNVVKYARSWQGVMVFFARTRQWGRWRRYQTERLQRLHLTDSKSSRPPKYRFTPRQEDAWRRLVAAVTGAESVHGSGSEDDNHQDESDDGTNDEFDDSGDGSVDEGDDRQANEDEAKQDNKSADDESADDESADEEDEEESTEDDDEDSDFDPDEGGSDVSMGSDRSARPAPRQPRRRRGRPSSPGRDWSQVEMTSAHQACVDFCLYLLKQKVLRTDYDCALTCATAALGVHQDGRWRATDTYSPVLSELIKIARFLVVHRATEIVMARNRGGRHGSPGQIGCPEKVGHLMDSFMVRGTDGPMQRMVHLRSRCMQLNKQRTTEGRVQWIGDRVLYKDVGFDMDQLRAMVRDLIGQTRRILVEELLLLPAGGGRDGTPPSIPWASLVDDASNEDVDWNFLQDRRASWAVDGGHWLEDHVQGDPGRQRRFMTAAAVGSRRQTWDMTRQGATAESLPITAAAADALTNEAGVRNYMKAVVRFREKLAVLVHITGGQPARGPELLSIRHTNTAGGGHRNVFIEDGYVAMATRYHKGHSSTQMPRIIHRYVPPGGRGTGGMVPVAGPSVPAADGTAALARGHGDAGHVARIYGQPPVAHGSRPGRAGAYQHLAIATGRRYLSGRETFRYREADREGDREDPDVQAGEIMDRQAAHQPDVAGRVYARTVGEQQGVVASRREQYRLSSLAWHRKVLGFVAPRDSTREPTPAVGSEAEGAESRGQEWWVEMPAAPLRIDDAAASPSADNSERAASGPSTRYVTETGNDEAIPDPGDDDMHDAGADGGDSARPTDDDTRDASEPMLLSGMTSFADRAGVGSTGAGSVTATATASRDRATGSHGESVRDGLQATVRIARLTADSELIKERARATGARQWATAHASRFHTGDGDLGGVGRHEPVDGGVGATRGVSNSGDDATPHPSMRGWWGDGVGNSSGSDGVGNGGGGSVGEDGGGGK
ncbi:hypothetical protein V8E54_015117 [Elaphomyces granulatus]